MELVRGSFEREEEKNLPIARAYNFFFFNAGWKKKIHLMIELIALLYKARKKPKSQYTKNT